MGLSVAIAGAIVMVTIMFVLFAVPNVVYSIFSVGDASLKASLLGDTISQTEISMEDLDVQVNSPKVNFTVINEGQEKLWDYEKFNVIITYDEASGRPTESMTYSGDCLGVVPNAGNWCIETISDDVKDPDVINGGESARIWTQVNQDLITGNTVVSFNTDNGATATLPVTSRSSVATGVDPPVACQSGFYGRTFIDTDTGISYICDPTRDKWLSFETMTLIGEENGVCDNNDDFDADPDCHIDFGDGVGGGPFDNNPDLGIYFPYDFTVIAYGLSMDNDDCGAGSYDIEVWSTGDNADDNNYAFEDNIAVGLNGEAHNDNNLDVDIGGNQYTIWGIDNNCPAGGSDIDDYNIIIYFKWRHD